MATISTRPWYKDWFDSPFYHKLYFERDEKEAKAFIQKLMHFLQPAAGSSMIDIGCGRGRHSKILAEMGFDVTGVDLSFASVNYAKQFEKENLHFYQHDIRYLFRINFYEFAFNFFTSFGYFSTHREHDDAIRTIGACLRPGGVFVMDYLNPHYVEEHLVHDEVKNISGTTFEIKRWDDESHFYKRIVVTDASLTSPEEYTEQVVKFSVGELSEMMGFRGLQIVEVFGDYNMDPYDLRKTPRMILVAKKTGGDEQGEKGKRLYSDGRKTDALG